jgi:Uma2 family endonuclease
MATQTLLTIEQYAALDEPVGVRYELSEGELIVTPSASFRHNNSRDRVTARLQAFLDAHSCGEVTSVVSHK